MYQELSHIAVPRLLMPATSVFLRSSIVWAPSPAMPQRAVRNCYPLPIAASEAVAPNAPIPGLS